MDSKILDRHKATVSNLLKIYDGIEPLHLYLKKYFAENKKHGSRDRKAITGLCYGYFRLGQNAQRLQKNHPDGPALSVSKVLDIAGYITGILPYPAFLEENRGKDNMTASLVPEPLPMDRFNAIARHYDCLNQDALFPFDAATSPDLDLPDFRASMLSQPRLFIRMRPQKGTHTHSEVMRVLRSGEIAFLPMDKDILSLAPNTPVDPLLRINKDVVIQDISSQRMAVFLEKVLEDRNKNLPGCTQKKLKVWDCCAASGGKSLLLWDVFKNAGQKIDLTVSDIRRSILKNLDKRFKEAGITGYKKQVLDLVSPGTLPFTNGFDLVICDVPCSGSGTWARTPEQIQYFEETKIASFYARQTAIAQKAWQSVEPGGYFLYMTCSVFEQENEAVVRFISANSGMELVASRLITGYKENGDSMFGALFTRTK